MSDALIWFLAVEVVGLLALPLAFVLFRRLPDRGFTLAKPMGLVLFSYVLWVLGLTHLVPNTQITVFLILLGAGVLGAAVFRRVAAEFKEFVRSHWRMLVAAELVFIGFFIIWTTVVSQAPAINHTEKPMDFGFMNAVLQSRFFPPEDPWLSGNPISYYYFGHFMMAFLAQLTGVASSVGYNLSVALVPALVGIGAFGLLYNLVRASGGAAKPAVLTGLAAALLIVFAGNLEGGLEFVKTLGWGGDGFWDWVGIKGLEGGAGGGSGGFPDGHWWWFRASRVIDTLAGGRSLDYTITEFPMFSFVLGDLHPHMVNLPFMILGIGLALNLYRSPDPLGPIWLARHPVQSVAIGLFTGSLAFINTWDLPVIAGLLAVVMLTKAYGDYQGDLKRAALNAGAVLVPVLVLAIALFLPFYLDLDAQMSGLLPLRDVATRPFLLFVSMGLFLVLALAFIARQLRGIGRPAQTDSPVAVLVTAAVLFPLLIWAVPAFLVALFTGGPGDAFGELGRRAVLVIPGLAIVAVAGFSAARRTWPGDQTGAAFVLLLAGLGFYLIVGAELFYIVDSFSGAFRRMNTVFKVYYQAWLLLGVVGSYAIYYLWANRSGMAVLSERGWRPQALRAGAYVGGAGLAVLLAASFYYPVGAVLDRTGASAGNASTLDGLAFLPDDEHAAIRWLRDEASWGRIVEAVGDDYSEFGRVSSSTGLPTVLGWKGHELQWRGSYAAFSGREDDVETIYSSPDAGMVRRLLESYGVRYVYLGPRERAAYGVTDLSHLSEILEPRFAPGDVIVYEMVPRRNILEERGQLFGAP